MKRNLAFKNVNDYKQKKLNEFFPEKGIEECWSPRVIIIYKLDVCLIWDSCKQSQGCFGPQLDSFV